jgi:hypothetical protein
MSRRFQAAELSPMRSMGTNSFINLEPAFAGGTAGLNGSQESTLPHRKLTNRVFGG